MAKSTYLINKTLAHNTGETAFTMPAAIYVALFTTDPTVAASGTEVAGNAYARKVATFVAGSNNTELSFIEATGAWGTVTHWALFDAATVGNMLYFAPVDSIQAVISGNIARFAIGAIDVTES